MNFSFGSNTPKTTAAATATPATGAPASTGLTFGSTPTSTPAFSLGGAGDSKQPTLAAPTATVKPVAATAPLGTSFSLGTTPTTTTATSGFPSFGLAQTTPATTAQTSTPGFSFGASSTSGTTTSVSFTSLTPATTTSTLKLGTTSTPSLGQATTAATSVATTTSSTTTAPTSAITFVQLEETIKKWTLELEEQEKIFMSQAAQINNWDNLLNSNSEKIVALNTEVGTMKLQQQQLDHELDFIFAQQRELEEMLVPLEKQTAESPSNVDPEREHTYHMAEALDTQLKQMSEDLREIIEHLNESSRTQDNSDPIVQIGRILNAHMNSLHWIDQMTLNIQNQLENVTKLHDIHRRENERSFRISYE